METITSFGTCSICAGAFTFDDISGLKCGHTFHGECIKKWIQQTENCPKCRTGNSLTDITKLYVDDGPINISTIHSSDLGLKENGWNCANTKAKISPNGLEADTKGKQNVYALKGFPISLKHNNFNNGKIVYYFEVKQQSSSSWADSDFRVGLSAGHDHSSFDYSSLNYYFISKDSSWCILSGHTHHFEWSYFATQPQWNGHGDVIGCGVMLKPETNVAIFFTLNGIIFGKQIPIHPSVVCLFPSLHLENACFEANFGNDPAKPFKYDISKCP